MEIKRFDTFMSGFVAGMLGPFVGFLCYGLYWSSTFEKSLFYFVNNLFLGSSTFQSSIVSLSLLANLALFFLCFKLKIDKAARGVLGATFVYAPVVIILKFV